MADTLNIDALIELARAGKRPTEDQVKEVIPIDSGGGVRNRRNTMSMLVKIAGATRDGQQALADDLVDDLQFALNPDAQKTEADKLAKGIDRLGVTKSVESRRAAGQVRAAAQAQLDGLLLKAAAGESVSDHDIEALHIAEHITDAQLTAFRQKLDAALADVGGRRGDPQMRDGRNQRAEDATYAARKHVRELLDEGVIGADEDNWDSLPSDPRALAQLIGR